MALYNLEELLKNNTYPGRGIVIGCSPDGQNAYIAYFIMGRSENSRNRIFEKFDGGMRTKAYDESKMVDPSLVIYNPLRLADGIDIITNGDQTDTIYEFVKNGKTFEEALMTREFEPDSPNYTPRISGVVYYRDNTSFDYKMSILKSANGDPSVCQRFFYNYSAKAGIGHFIHTYKCDGNPIPSFYGEPEEVSLPQTVNEFAEMIWNNLNNDNKVSLYVRSVSLVNNKSVNEIIYNKKELK